jgi:anthranilate phosphoribosyltransferase
MAEVYDGNIRRLTVAPEDFGVASAPLEAICGGTPAENSEIIRRVFAGEGNACADIVIMNAAAALVAAGLAENFRQAAQLAGETIRSGAAQAKLSALCAFTNTTQTA